jgi:adenylate cyclase
VADEVISLREASARAGVSEATLKRWAAQKVVPLEEGRWTAAAAAQARVVARMRERGHSLREIAAAVRDGRLAFGYVEDLLPTAERRHSRAEVAESLGIEEDLVERIMALLGTPLAFADRLTDEDLEALDRLSRTLNEGFPLVALLQLVRVYAQSLRRIAEAEVRLFHLFVHEPLIREGVPAIEMAEQMEEMAGRLLPVTGPLMEYVHSRYLRFYLEQDVVGHMESDLPLDRRSSSRVTMAFAFVDLTGFTRFTEEEGDAEALDLVERFIETVESTLPAEATIVKTIGDEVMVIAPEPEVLTEWAVGFIALFENRPRPRTGLHYGSAMYRDGDYFGGEVNLAHRVAARALAGEVLVTRSLVDEIGSSKFLEFESVGEVNLKGFPEPTELFIVARRTPAD